MTVTYQVTRSRETGPAGDKPEASHTQLGRHGKVESSRQAGHPQHTNPDTKGKVAEA